AWDKNYAPLVAARAGKAQTDLQAQQRRGTVQDKYEGSPDQRFMGWAVPGAVPAGTVAGIAESALLSRHLPTNRASILPFLAAAGGQGWKAADLYRQIGSNPDADPYSED